jgi:uncharacterized protein
LSRASLRHSRKEDGYQAIHVASKGGLTEVVASLVDLGVNADSVVTSELEPHVTPLIVAAMHSKPSVVNALLASKANIDFTPHKGWRVIHVASRSADIATLRAVLAGKPNVNLPTDEGMYSVHLAIARPENLKALCRYGADTTPRYPASFNHMTCLHIAAVKGYLDSVKLLCSYKAEMEAVDDLGRTPLACAAAHGQTAVVSFLLANCADVSSKDKTGVTVTELALAAGHKSTAAVLMDAHYTRLLVSACKGGQEDVALSLINSKMISSQNFVEPLRIAASYQLVPVLEALLEKGAAPDVRYGPQRNTLLLSACQSGRLQTASLLLKYGADPSARNDWFVTPLLEAALHGDAHMVRLLLHFNADLKAYDIRRGTPLHFAALSASPDAVDKSSLYLLRAGACPSAEHEDGDSPISLAIETNNVALLSLLLNKAKSSDLAGVRSSLETNPQGLSREIRSVIVLELVDRGMLLSPEEEQLGADTAVAVIEALEGFATELSGPWDHASSQAARSPSMIKPYRSVIRSILGSPSAYPPRVALPTLSAVHPKPHDVEDSSWRKQRTSLLREDAWERRNRLVCCFAAAQKSREPELKRAKMDLENDAGAPSK